MTTISNPGQPDKNNPPTTSNGNASNPPLKNEQFESTQNNQLIDKRGDKYLREVANLEDYPDAQDDQDMDETINRETKSQ